MINSQNLAHEDLYPGNHHAIHALQETLKDSELIPFVGAGASAPAYPLWGQVLGTLIDEAQSKGIITEARDLNTLRKQVDTDPLEVAASLEDAFHAQQFRERLADIFSPRGVATDCHNAIIALNPRAMVTTNYDDGLEVAYSRACSAPPYTIRGTDAAELTRWRQSRLATAGRAPLLHWHGVPSDPSGMVFTGDDYARFYSDPDRLSFLQQLWRDQRLLAIGFGFSDPFLTRIGESVLRSLPSDDRHFALIGVPPSREVSAVERKQFSRKYRLRPIFYPIGLRDDGTQDHSGLVLLLQSFAATVRTSARGSAPAEASSVGEAAENTAAQAARREFEKSLLVYNGRQLYVEPRINRVEVLEGEPASETPTTLTVDELIKCDSHVAMVTHPEYGSSTLCRRLVNDFTRDGVTAAYREAGTLPNYRKKLEDEFGDLASDPKAVLILDTFDPDRHERLLKEIVGTGIFARIFVVLKNNGLGISQSLADGSRGLNFSVVALSHLDREDLRTLAKDMFESSDHDLISMAVDKVYQDLLALCIPLTPANVIMYLTVLTREGDFAPLNRVQIVEKYVHDLLRRPSDAYRGAFNARNRADLTSTFVYNLFLNDRTHFDDRTWLDFCRAYKEESLLEFDERAILDDFLSARIFVRDGGSIVFKYRFFYSYFLGRHIANRPELLMPLVTKDRHLAVEGLVEAITALAADSAAVVEDLIAKLTTSLAEVQSSYPLQEQDPFLQIEWPTNDEEETHLWEPVAARLAAGPSDSKEVDQLKRSIQAEKRTQDQRVALIEFDKLESKIVLYTYALVDALNSSESLSGDIKKRALDALFDSHSLTYMVGLLHAPSLAKYRVFYWNGVIFLNEIDYAPEVGEDQGRRTFAVALEMATAVADKVASELGSKKLAEAYKLFATTKNWIGFKQLMLLALLLRSKPRGWQAAAESVVNRTSRKSFFLRFSLSIAFRQFDREVNTNQERDELKRVIAAIRAKRDLKKDAPGSKLITNALRQLEKQGVFSKSAHDKR